MRAVDRHQQQRRRVGIDLTQRAARISLGRPVLPPDVIALNGIDTASGNGPASTSVPGVTSATARTTTFDFASSMIASSSRAARRTPAQGTAPDTSAMVVARNSTLFGERDRHEVARNNIAIGQQPRDLVGQRLQLGPGHGPVLVGNGRPVGQTFGVVGEAARKEIIDTKVDLQRR